MPLIFHGSYRYASKALKSTANTPDILGLLDPEYSYLAIKAYLSVSNIGAHCSIWCRRRLSINFMHYIHASPDRRVIVEGRIYVDRSPVRPL